MQNGTLSVTAAGNAITAALKTKAGADPSPGDPVTVDFLDRAGGYRTVGITAPLSTTIPQGVTGGLPSLMPCRGWWHLVDGPSPQIGFACYTGPSRILKPRDGGLINAVAPGNNPFTVYTPSAVSNVSSRVIGCSTWESSIPVAGQWIAPTNTDLWRPGMPLPLDIIDSGQTSTPVSQFTVANPPPNQWFSTNISAVLTPKSAANAIEVTWCGNGLTSAANHQITVGAFRNGAVHVGLLGIAWSATDQLIVPMSSSWLDFPGSSSPVSYIMKLMGDGGGNFSFSYGANVSGANGQPVMQLVEVMT